MAAQVTFLFRLKVDVDRDMCFPRNQRAMFGPAKLFVENFHRLTGFSVTFAASGMDLRLNAKIATNW